MSIGRWFRHTFTTPGAVRRAFPEPVLTRIHDAIVASESRHSGELRFAVEGSLPWSYLRREAPARERAQMMFAKLRVWDTAANNGVLIFVELADHQIEIVADRGIGACVENAQWHVIAATMRDAFRRNRFEEGAIAGVKAVGDLLAQHFPLVAGESNPNQLPDRPVVL